MLAMLTACFKSHNIVLQNLGNKYFDLKWLSTAQVGVSYEPSKHDTFIGTQYRHMEICTPSLECRDPPPPLPARL